MPPAATTGAPADATHRNRPAFSIDGGVDAQTGSGDRSGIDESALRYYAEQRNLERVGAEIRRLKTLYPAWTPPADLFAPKSDVDEQPLWDLFAAGRFAEVRSRIATYQAQHPTYRPSADLATKLDDADARQRIKTAFEAGDWSSSLAAARERPSLLVCAEMDVLWQVGEAFARSGDLARAFDLYGYVLTTCDNPGERLATMQKAALLLPQKGVDALITFGGTLANGSREFDGIRFQKLRAQIGEAIAAGQKRSRVSANDLQAYERFAKATLSAEDASLLGWYHYNLQRFDMAKEWFSLASDIKPNPKHLEGYVLSLRNLDELDTAEDLAYREYEDSPELAKIYVELVADRMNDPAVAADLSVADLGRFQTVVEDTRSALGAQTLGWHLLEDEKIHEAGTWFEKSVDWDVTEEGVLGLAVVASRTKNNAGLKQIKARYGDEFATLAEIEEYAPPARVVSYRPGRSAAPPSRGTRRARSGGGDKLMRQANQQFQAGDYNGALATLNKREARSGKSYGAEVLKGWVNIKLRRWDEADRIFRNQDKKRSTRDTRFGIGAVANSKYGMWPEDQNNCKVRFKC
ncbi:conserved hypothetical protein [Aurantimonas manganoxydans SI85-9A1]|uniref:Tetratricopeptide repeat protein n=1 Tax=Aurantimonas manganoxydans (strain ATCC BAA-1229 / DSM 21871 / SI85-9A1) TaxID=287752 RepID=Q1YMU8_AURMS|nr:conserved hypothetical protein [Aurantimonas manganoxydans SI85-9A1]